MKREFPKVDLEPMDGSLRGALFANPLFSEFRRSMRKFWTGGTGAINAGVTVIAAIVYLTVLGITVSFRESVEPAFIWGTLLVFLMIAIPAVSHGAIAGEREKRTWDSLLTAPLTNREIVLGKYFSGLGIAGVIIAFFIPLGPITLFNKSVTPDKVLGGFVVVLGYAIFLQALTIFISSRCSRGHAAQVATLAAQFAILLLFPVMSSVFFQNGQAGWQRANFYNPWLFLADQLGPVKGAGFIQFGAYIALALILVWWTTAKLLTQDGVSRGGP